MFFHVTTQLGRGPNQYSEDPIHITTTIRIQVWKRKRHSVKRVKYLIVFAQRSNSSCNSAVHFLSRTVRRDSALWQIIIYCLLTTFDISAQTMRKTKISNQFSWAIREISEPELHIWESVEIFPEDRTEPHVQ